MRCKYNLSFYNNVKAHWTGGKRLGVGIEIHRKKYLLDKHKFEKIEKKKKV